MLKEGSKGGVLHEKKTGGARGATRTWLNGEKGELFAFKRGETGRGTNNAQGCTRTREESGSGGPRFKLTRSSKRWGKKRKEKSEEEKGKSELAFQGTYERREEHGCDGVVLGKKKISDGRWFTLKSKGASSKVMRKVKKG